MNNEIQQSITVPKSQIEKMLNAIHQCDSETPISLEFILTALFPTVWKNIQIELHQQYTQGYIQGLNDKQQGENCEN